MIPKNASCVKHPVRSALDLSQTAASAAHPQGNCLLAQCSTKFSHHHLEKRLCCVQHQLAETTEAKSV